MRFDFVYIQLLVVNRKSRDPLYKAIYLLCPPRCVMREQDTITIFGNCLIDFLQCCPFPTTFRPSTSAHWLTFRLSLPVPSLTPSRTNLFYPTPERLMCRSSNTLLCPPLPPLRLLYRPPFGTPTNESSAEAHSLNLKNQIYQSSAVSMSTPCYGQREGCIYL
ncbi:hypothetical protein K435DRAFT_395410 [Dendrothele bispora CBS 962.96]|uniref:Uncharacterized protein n=1 Tax=Dendrothele bispora (strain CBS 962.96) TaxID=1314807 RepID=A0A4S8L8F7_DENBC|nr:hypothetical protein K435DRAFT_395410 [Dendrothele bispora CBS 962.96]